MSPIDHAPRHRRPSLRLPLLMAASLVAGQAIAGPQEDARAVNALRVLTDIQAIPESAIPDKLLDEGRAIVVVPDSLKAGFVLGGRRGKGVMAVKNADGTWSNPSFVTLTGGSIGLQAGVQSSDIVLVFGSDRGLESIVNGKFTLGGDASVAAGPVGRNASAATDGELKAEIWSWSRARGLFAGVALDGAVLGMDHRANEAVYGRDTTPRMIFEGRANQVPSNAIVDFRDRLEEATASARQARHGDPRGAVATAPAAPSVTGTAAVTQPMVAEPQPQPFQTVENPASVQPLPEQP